TTSPASRLADRIAASTIGDGESTEAVKSITESSAAPRREKRGLRPTVSAGVTIPPAGLKPRTARTHVPLPGLESREPLVLSMSIAATTVVLDTVSREAMVRSAGNRAPGRRSPWSTERAMAPASWRERGPRPVDQSPSISTRCQGLTLLRLIASPCLHASQCPAHTCGDEDGHCHRHPQGAPPRQETGRGEHARHPGVERHGLAARGRLHRDQGGEDG